MANLSHLLGNVYGDDDSAATTDDDHVGRSHAEERADAERTDERADDERTDATDERADATTASGAERPPRDAPDWASDERLDAAFGDWTAGEMPDMERDHREDLTADDDADDAGEDPAASAASPPELAEPAASPPELAEPAASPPEPVEPAASVEPPPTSGKAELRELAPDPNPEPAPAEPARSSIDDQLDGPAWELTHDDILPSSGGGVLQLLRRR